jgi:hypothetical protein
MGNWAELYTYVMAGKNRLFGKFTFWIRSPGKGYLTFLYPTLKMIYDMECLSKFLRHTWPAISCFSI